MKTRYKRPYLLNFTLQKLVAFLAFVLITHIGNAQVSSNDIPYPKFNPGKQFALIIEPEKTNYFQGQPITLHVVVKNIGGEDGDVIVENPLILYDAFVTLTNKMVIPPTLKGRQIIRNSRMIISGGHEESVKPGETTSPLSYPLSQIYDLSSPNTYRVRVAREFTIDFDAITKKYKTVRVVSNEVEITVENKPPLNN